MIEKNIIFIHPLSPLLQKFLKEMEEDDDFMVFEIDALNEYGQIIGVLEQSVTFSSDLKKSRTYLEDFSQFVKNKNSRNYLIQESTMAPHLFSKMQTLGLNELIKEATEIKTLKHKINMFFSMFETGENQIAVNETPSLGAKKQKENNIQRAQPLAFDKPDTLFNFDKKNSKKKAKSYDFGNFSNYKMKKNKTDMSFLNSNFSDYQKKAVTEFTPQLKNLDLKKTNFEPITGVLKNNPFKKSLEIKPPGELKRKEVGTFEEVKSLNGKPKKDPFAPMMGDMNRKDVGKFEEQTREIKPHKKLNLPELELKRRELAKKEVEERKLKPKKKMTDLPELIPKLKKHAKFEPVAVKKNVDRKETEEAQELKRKKQLALDELELKRKKSKTFEESIKDKNPSKNFEEVQIDKNKVKGQEFEEQEFDKDRKNFEEADPNKKKKGSTFDEFHEDQTVKEKEIDLGEDLKPKKKNFQEVDPDKKGPKKFDENLGELDKLKKGFQENIIDLEKNKGKFEEIEIEKKKKKSTFGEKPLENLKSKSVDFEEIKTKRKALEKQIEPEKEEYDLLLKYSKDKKLGPESVLDYKQLHREYKEGKLKLNAELEEKVKRKNCDQLALEKDFTLLEFDSYGVEYFITYNDLIWKSAKKPQVLLKFVHFALLKEFSAEVCFYTLQDGKYQLAYNGITEKTWPKLFDEFDKFEAINKVRWEKTELPTWSDETYQANMNEFIYPYYEEGEPIGFAVAHFPKTITNHMDAKKAELLLNMSKGVFLEDSIL